MKHGHIVGILGLVALAACSKPEAAPGDRPSAAARPVSNAPLTELETKYNIGDVDYAFKLITQLAEESRIGNVAYTESETKRGELAMAEATVRKPYPTSLWITATARTPVGLRQTDAVLVHQKVYIDGRPDPIAEQSFVWTHRDGAHNPNVIKVDLTPHLDAVSESVLLYSRAQIIWFPDRSTDSVALTEEPLTPQHAIEKISNTLRITFN